MNVEELRQHLCDIYPALCPLFSEEYGDGVLTVDYYVVHDTAEDLKRIGFERLGMVTAVDREGFFEMVYRFKSREIGVALFVKCAVPKSEPKVRSMVDLWPSAEWPEREVYDMFGIEFEGHPDLRRILLPEDWVGHPLRKDYQDDRIVRRPDYI